jgi:hypothetical protein
MAREDVRAAVNRRIDQASMRSQLTVERVQEEIARVAFSNPKRLFDESGELKPLHELGDDDAAAIASIENEELYEGTGKDRERTGTVKKLKLWDKGSALELPRSTWAWCARRRSSKSAPSRSSSETERLSAIPNPFGTEGLLLRCAPRANEERDQGGGTLGARLEDAEPISKRGSRSATPTTPIRCCSCTTWSWASAATRPQ